MALRELLNQQAGNPRKGQRYRNEIRDGQVVHDYASGPDQVVGPARGAQMGAQISGGEGTGHPAGFAPTNQLSDLLKGAAAYEQQHGDGGLVGAHMHDAGGQAPRANALGVKFVPLSIGGRNFHVYFSPDGQRLVREVGVPHATASGPQ